MRFGDFLATGLFRQQQGGVGPGVEFVLIDNPVGIATWYRIPTLKQLICQFSAGLPPACRDIFAPCLLDPITPLIIPAKNFNEQIWILGKLSVYRQCSFMVAELRDKWQFQLRDLLVSDIISGIEVLKYLVQSAHIEKWTIGFFFS